MDTRICQIYRMVRYERVYNAHVLQRTCLISSGWLWMQPCELGIGFEGFQPCHSPVHVLAILCWHVPFTRTHRCAARYHCAQCARHSWWQIHCPADHWWHDWRDRDQTTRDRPLQQGRRESETSTRLHKKGGLTRRVQIKFKQTGGSVAARTELPSRIN